MSSTFQKLIFKKREKMLILVVLLTVGTIFVQQSHAINLTYIVKKDGKSLQPSCIAEENERYAAIGWIYPLPNGVEQEPNIVTKFEPDIQNEFNCKFGKNDKCNKNWALKNWAIDDKSEKTLELTFDDRWNDFPAVFTGKAVKEFKDRFEIPNIFKAGFSLRTSGSVELLLCEGWNPQSYPCYHLNISQNSIFLRKYMTLPKNISLGDKMLDSYTAVANIVSGDEWRNFIINLDDNGVISLTDIIVNRTVIQYEDKEPLKTMYLLVRSIQPAVWKIHSNHFIYTKTPQTSRLGPILYLPSKQLCVALYVLMCPHCAMSFIIMKGTNKHVLLEVEPSTKSIWRLVKLKDNQILVDKINIFVETRFIMGANTSNAFWAIDNVRVCNENEVKVSFLKLKNEVEVDDEVACQVVEHPKWRPKRLVYEKIRDFPKIDATANTSSILLNWTQEDPNNLISYFITYQANDICNNDIHSNFQRIKSNGFIMTKHNEILLDNLIPYTKYNITFSSILHDTTERTSVDTLETERPTPEELPSRLQMQIEDTHVYASWDKVACNTIYGPILYRVSIKNLATSIRKEIKIQGGNIVKINDLQPFTNYTLQITTARNFKNIQTSRNIVQMELNFTTKAGIAGIVQNLEVYATDKNSVSLRYDLPKKAYGQPKNIQVLKCSAIIYAKCRNVIADVTPCILWPQKYCITLNGLIPNQVYSFKVSLKNENTHIWGADAIVHANLTERVPGTPTNLTYRIVNCAESVEYCDLNITWRHPYEQNGSINAFNIVLNASDSSNEKNIQEVLKISNNSYTEYYNYQIKIIPYSTHYELYVQSVNTKFKSDFIHTHVKTADIGDHIDQSPQVINTSSKTATFKLPSIDHRLNGYDLQIVVQDFDKKLPVPRDVLHNKKIADHLCHNFGTSWILPLLHIRDNKTKTLTIGENDTKELKPNTQYCFTFIVINKYRNTQHDVVYYKKLKTSADQTTASPPLAPSQTNHLYALLLLLLLVPIGFLLYRYIKKRKAKPKKEETRENVYESLPFEECEENCVSNETYDQLLHK